MDKHATIHDVAQAFSWALRLGIVNTPNVVDWADGFIARHTENSLWILELSMVREDRNAALTLLNEVSSGHDFRMAFGLFVAMADDVVRMTEGSCYSILRRVVSVLRDQSEWMDAPEKDEAWELYVIEDELEDGYATDEDARAAIAKFADPYRTIAVANGVLR